MSNLRAQRKPLRAQPKLGTLQNEAKPATSPLVAGNGVPSAINVRPAPSAPALRVGPLGRVIIGAGGTGLFFTCLYSAYGPASVGDMKATVVMLVSGWVFAVGAFTLSELLSSFSNRHRFLASFGFAIVCAVITVAWGTTIFHVPPPPVQKTGAMIFFRVGGLTRDKKKLEVNMVNQGDVMARVWPLVGVSYVIANHILSVAEEDERYQVALKTLPPLTGTGMEVPINIGHIIEVDLSNITNEQYDTIIAGTGRLYLVVIARFRDELTPSDKTNLASVCAHFNKNIEAGLACLTHTESRMQN